MNELQKGALIGISGFLLAIAWIIFVLCISDGGEKKWATWLAVIPINMLALWFFGIYK